MQNFFDLLSIKEKIKVYLSEEQRKKIRLMRLKLRNYEGFLFSLLFSKNLKSLAVLYGTDKWGFHQYAQHYEFHFKKLRKKKLNILEIGIGGYSDPNAGGDSLRMWRTFFPHSKIIGIDIYDKSYHNEKRIKTFQGSQIDEEFLSNLISETGNFDIIIDDGSHINEHIIKSFKFLFDKLNPGGIYVIEDLQTAYWDEYGGSPDLNQSPETNAMSFLLSLVHSLNYQEIPRENYIPTYFDVHISAITFYHNIAFIYKNTNGNTSVIQ